MKRAEWQEGNVGSPQLPTGDKRWTAIDGVASKKHNGRDNDADDGTSQNGSSCGVFGSADMLVWLGGEAITEDL